MKREAASNHSCRRLLKDQMSAMQYITSLRHKSLHKARPLFAKTIMLNGVEYSGSIQSKQLDITVTFDDDARHEISRGKRQVFSASN